MSTWSPYCMRRYVVDGRLGGPKWLAAARSSLRERGLRLILDFVPNHVTPDHPWVGAHPNYFVTGRSGIIARIMHLFATSTGEQVLELGNLGAITELEQEPGSRPRSAATVREV